jgi:hypothetical protein
MVARLRLAIKKRKRLRFVKNWNNAPAVMHGALGAH